MSNIDLSRSLGFATSDPETFSERISHMSPDVSVGKLRQAGFSGEATPVILPELRVARIAVRNADVVAPAGRSYSSVTIPLTSEFEIVDRGTTHQCGPPFAHIQSSDLPFHLKVGHATVIVVNIEDKLLAEVAAMLMGVDTGHELSLNDEISLLDERASAFWRMATTLWCEMQRNSELFQSPIVLRERERALVEQLLLSVNSQAARNALARGNASESGLQRAENWILEHLNQPITRGDLCEVSGLNVRTLSRAFRRRHEQSPMGFVRERRLDAVRRKLLAAEVEQTSVSEVALDYGFCHLSRFAADYRRAFGEYPSDTLRH